MIFPRRATEPGFERAAVADPPLRRGEVKKKKTPPRAPLRYRRVFIRSHAYAVCTGHCIVHRNIVFIRAFRNRKPKGYFFDSIICI